MHPLATLLGLVALLAAATAIGLLLKRRRGRVRQLSDNEVLTPADFGAERFGQAGTIVQFSTDFCSRCPGVRRLLTQQTAATDGLEFLHVDLTHDPQLAARFGVLQTPTILFVEADGRPSTRLSGQLDHQRIRDAVGAFAAGINETPARQATSDLTADLADRHTTTNGAIA